MSDDSRKAAELWQWEHDGNMTRAKMEMVIGGEVVKEFPWSKWVRFPTPINRGYWAIK